MQVRDSMTRDVVCTPPEATLQEVASQMKELNVGTLPVCDDDDRLVGMITDRDIAIRAVAKGRDPKLTRVHEAMTPEVIYCFEDQTVQEAAEIMKNNQVRRLVVMNRDKKLVGILSIGDIAVDAHDDTLTGDALESISEPVHPKH